MNVSRLLVTLMLVAAPAAVLAQSNRADVGAGAKPSKDTYDAVKGLLDRQPPPAPAKPVAERPDVVSWQVLAEVTTVKQKDRFVPSFSPKVTALDKREVRLQGFVMPLEMGERQSNFILSATTVDCAFCMPSGPDAMVEVRAKTPIKYGFEPVVLSGRFAVLKDDPSGIYYRLTDAVLVTR